MRYPPVDVFLPTTPDADRSGRYIVGNDRTGGGIRTIADCDGCHKDRIAADSDTVPDDRWVLCLTVIVGENGCRPNVGADANFSIADIRQVWNFALRADGRLLYFDVCANSIPSTLPGRRNVKGPTLAPSPISAWSQ